MDLDHAGTLFIYFLRLMQSTFLLSNVDSHKLVNFFVAFNVSNSMVLEISNLESILNLVM
jgi:hypothetical protein